MKVLVDQKVESVLVLMYVEPLNLEIPDASNKENFTGYASDKMNDNVLTPGV